jgi:hypothetical protein
MDRAKHHDWMGDICRAAERHDHDPTFLRLIDYHAAMASKYRDAARYAWLSVPPDPPMPE